MSTTFRGCPVSLKSPKPGNSMADGYFGSAVFPDFLAVLQSTPSLVKAYALMLALSAIVST
jgi:hypothetical protein